MSIRFTAIILTFSLLLPIYAQDAFYKHFEGKVDKSINIVVDLVKSGERLSGYYYYYFDDRSGDTAWTHYGKSMPIAGTMKDVVFEFSEFEPEVKGAIFRGSLSKGIMDGTWTSADGKKQLPLNLKEAYPEGTMPFTAYYLKESGPLFEKKTNPSATIEASLLTPAIFSHQAVSDSVQYIIFDHFFGRNQSVSNPKVLMAAMKDIYFANYRTANADLYQEGASSFDWQKRKEVRILHNEKSVLSLEFFDYGFTGGAHGLSLSNFHVFDLEDGHQITLGDVFRDDYSNDLRDIINAAARNKYRLQRNQPMTAAGFFVESLDPTSNFYITKDGMGFYYNQYEVAPFALGPIEIFVNYSDLRRILRADSPVYRIIPK